MHFLEWLECVCRIADVRHEAHRLADEEEKNGGEQEGDARSEEDELRRFERISASVAMAVPAPTESSVAAQPYATTLRRLLDEKLLPLLKGPALITDAKSAAAAHSRRSLGSPGSRSSSRRSDRTPSPSASPSMRAVLGAKRASAGRLATFAGQRRSDLAEREGVADNV